MKALPRWGANIVGDTEPNARLELLLSGEVLCRAELFNRQVKIGSEIFGLVGIGGVWTRSDHRNQGCATRLLDQAKIFSRLHSGMILFSLEQQVPFYENRGYTRHTGAATMRQPLALDAREVLHGPPIKPLKAVPVPEHVAVMTTSSGTWFDPEEPIDIAGLPW